MLNSPTPGRPYGSYKTRYAIPSRKDPEERLRDASDGSIETGDIPDPSEPYLELISSTGWELTWRFVLEPFIDELRASLLNSTSLSPEERARQQGGLFALGEVLKRLYTRAGEKVPVGVEKAFK
ncbi:MAG: hypothetical protein KGL39_27215 [Patescibacteria group bacterium]|nr:hypothetical protein [Patescibacteria group bacterium]